MKKIIFLIIVAVAVFMGGKNYFEKRAMGDLKTPAVVLSDNSEVHNVANVNPKCLLEDDINRITGKQYSLKTEVYTAAVTMLECNYVEGDSIANVTPTIRYKLQLPNNPAALWNKNKNALKDKSSFQESSLYPDMFANINQVKEIDQGTFYAFLGKKYIELTYTPVSEGRELLFDRGMSITQKAINY